MTQLPILNQNYLVELIKKSDLQTIGRICSSHPQTRQMCIQDPQIRNIILDKYDEDTIYNFPTVQSPKTFNRYNNLRQRIPGLYDGPGSNIVERQYSFTNMMPNIIDDQNELDAWISQNPNNQFLEFPTVEGNFLFNCPDSLYPFPFFKPNTASNKDQYPCLPVCSCLDGIGRELQYSLCDPRTPTTPTRYPRFGPVVPPVYQ